jgi:hypothetical protein
MSKTTTTEIPIDSVKTTPPIKNKEGSIEGVKATQSIESKGVPKKRGPGRPKKKDIIKNSPKGNRPVGRPKGDAAVMQEYKARMLASPKSAQVLKAIMDAALDPDHKSQAAAWKIVTDRILPVSMFEKDVVKGAGRNQVTVNIVTTGTAEVEEEIIDAEFED